MSNRYYPRSDRVALEVFERAQQGDEPVTMQLVKKVIAEMGEKASPDMVYTTATIWERSIHRARTRARS